eukprot:330690-Chlamydomonas_euryale.AAC.2
MSLGESGWHLNRRARMRYSQWLHARQPPLVAGWECQPPLVARWECQPPLVAGWECQPPLVAGWECLPPLVAGWDFLLLCAAADEKGRAGYLRWSGQQCIRMLWSWWSCAVEALESVGRGWTHG